MVDSPDPVYARTYSMRDCELHLFIMEPLTKVSGKVEERNEAYYAKYPEDIDRVRNIVQYLKVNRVHLPSGILSPPRFQQIGLLLGTHGKYGSRMSCSLNLLTVSRRYRRSSR